MRGRRIPTTLVMYWMAEGLQYAKMGVVHNYREAYEGVVN